MTDNVVPFRRLPVASMIGQPCSTCERPMHTVAIAVEERWYCQRCVPAITYVWPSP